MKRAIPKRVEAIFFIEASEKSGGCIWLFSIKDLLSSSTGGEKRLLLEEMKIRNRRKNSRDFGLFERNPGRFVVILLMMIY